MSFCMKKHKKKKIKKNANEDLDQLREKFQGEKKIVNLDLSLHKFSLFQVIGQYHQQQSPT